MAKITYRTEDEIRDEAKSILGFGIKEPKVQQGTGQICKSRLYCHPFPVCGCTGYQRTAYDPGMPADQLRSGNLPSGGQDRQCQCGGIRPGRKRQGGSDKALPHHI